MIRSENRKPNFEYFKRMLEKKPTPRPVLFDFIIGEEMTKFLAEEYDFSTEYSTAVTKIRAFHNAGYDFTPILIRGMEFMRKSHDDGAAQTKSLNSEALIVDRESFASYQWPNPQAGRYSLLKEAGKKLPENMKFLAYSHDGILENVIGIVGFENLCYMIYDDEELVEKIFFEVGSRIEKFFAECIKYDEVGAILCNDDWGFNSQTMVSPEILRKHVFPWYKRIVAKAHEAGKPAILHSCGYYYDIIDDIIYDMKFDGRHSYEDKIVPVEKAYEELNPKLAVIGGIDLNFLVRSTPEEVYRRTKAMIDKTKDRGGYAVGSGNSIPDFVPKENYLALLQAGLEESNE